MNAHAPDTLWQRRLTWVTLGLCAAGAALVWRAFDLQVLDKTFLQARGDARHLRVVPLPAHRGNIVDRQGDILAASTPVDSIWVSPEDIDLNDPQWAKLAQFLNLPLPQIHSHIQTYHDRSFVYLRRHIAPDLKDQVMALKLAGVFAQREYRRFYPSGEIATQVLGVTDVDDHGIEGLELAYDGLLRGTPGAERVVKDLLGKAVERVELVREANPGALLALSIDHRIQYLAYRELKAAVLQHHAQAGSAVVLDTHTGEVLAMVNLPAYNPNNRPEYRSVNARNRAVTDVLEPGSTIKPFAVITALTQHAYAPQTLIDTRPGSLQIGGRTIRDVHNYGVIDVAQIIQKSSNVGIAKIALSLPKEALWQTYNDAGLGRVTDSGFPGEASGRLPPHRGWHTIDQASLSFGYSMAVTPLQLAHAYVALANDGLAMPISFIKRNVPPDGYRVLDGAAVRAVRTMLETVVEEDGTGVRARVPGYRIAGKTGTVRKVGVNGYMENKYLSLFAGFAPASRPRLAMVVVVDEPTGAYYGGQVAAPVFGAVMAEALRMLDVPPDNTPKGPLKADLLAGIAP
ncbi:MAG: penicillin-binding transpeptidase domain-containing protein [Gammaproteobacteria bacterium]|nr:penicillin-binding transpeptidase domain-containing protein [Gammaproteobacteria bacterium]